MWSVASRIQGITVEIGGDTTKLSTALSKVNKEIRNTQSQLKDVNKLLKLDPGNTELMAQKQKLLTQAIDETTKDVVYEFDPGDIVKGSGYISSQCCNSTDIELGTVYSAEMGITLLTDIDRYTLEDALVELFYHLKIPDGSYEEVPMRIFEVSEANRKIKCLELKAYDFMLRFEKDFNGFETIGTAYDLIYLCCKACRVEFAQTEEEIRAMPNGSEVLSIYTENNIETCRDVLYYVGQILGGFFCINRYGKLELRKYGNVPVMEIQSRHRFTSSFSDFITAVYRQNS